MQDPNGISFFPSGPSLAVGVVVLVVTAYLCWLGWVRSGRRRGVGWLEVFRFILVALIGLTLCQPEWLETRIPEQQPTMVVLWDRSSSMETRDVVLGRGGEPVSRAEAMKPFLEEGAWRSAGEDLEVLFESFASDLEPAEAGTDLNAGLERVLLRQENLRGVVVMSDGDWNVGSSPVEAATRYRMRDIPVFGVVVGSEVPLPDVELVSMDAPTFGVAGKPLRVPFVVRGSLGQERELPVSLLVDGNVVKSQSVRVPAMGQVQDNVVWTFDEVGEHKVELQVGQDARDLVGENNRLEAPLSIRQEQLKVLVVESYPRWEYRYLRNALERDPGVEVTCLLFHPDLDAVGGGRGYIDQFPLANELGRYDVVFLGDVGVRSGQLTEEQAHDLRQLVTAQASGLVFVPGRNGMQGSLVGSALGDLLPVVMDERLSKGVGSPQPGHFSLTQAGRRSLLTRLADTDQENAEIWGRLPGFYWRAGVERAKAGAEVLAVHDTEATASGRVPLIVTRTYGTGKVLYMGTDGAWRWREGVEDKYHYRFWGQVARWMAYQRQMASGQSMRLFYSPDRPQVGEVLTLNANVQDSAGGPLSEGSVVVQVVSPSGKAQGIRLEAGEEDAWGLFVGSVVLSEPGDYVMVASCEETGTSVEASLSVQGLDRERQGRLARPEVLGEVAAVTGGRSVGISEVENLVDYLAALPEPEPVVHRSRIWSHPLWGGFLVLLLGLFWVGRKAVGTI